MKKILLFCLLGCVIFSAKCQCDSTLSKSGAIHWKVAQALIDMAVTVEDYEQVATEYEKVIETDSNYVAAYMKLGHIYTKIGNEKGLDALDKARYYFIMSKWVCEDSADEADIGIAIVDALNRKYTNGSEKFVGIWGHFSDEGIFTPDVKITKKENGYWFDVLFEDSETFSTNGVKFSNTVVVEVNNLGNACEYVTEFVIDFREELRKKGYKYDIIKVKDLDDYIQTDLAYRSGDKIKYDKWVYRYRYSISITNGQVLKRIIENHVVFYYDGQKTYSGIGRNVDDSPTVLVKDK